MKKRFWALMLAAVVETAFLSMAGLAVAAESQPGKQLALKSVAYRQEATSSNAPRRASKSKRNVRRAPARPSEGQMQGLHDEDDPLDLKSGVALVVDQDTQEVLLSKNAQAVLPIASITKLMTALVVAEADLPMGEQLEIDRDDVSIEMNVRSRLRKGTKLTREELMHLALMSSENRAAHALGRSYPGGMQAFVEAMNRKAAELGMSDTRFVEPTGLSSDNRSSAEDLATLVKAAYAQPLVRELSVSTGTSVAIGRRKIQYANTNSLVRNPSWNIGLQKTGYISAAGRCLVMQANLAGRRLIMVFLDSVGKYSRIGDAERVRRWLNLNPMPSVPHGFGRPLDNARSIEPGATSASIGVVSETSAGLAASELAADAVARRAAVGAEMQLPPAVGVTTPALSGAALLPKNASAASAVE